MATLTSKEAHFMGTLKQRVALDFDAVAAYRAAIERIDHPDARIRLGDFMGDHQRHIPNPSGNLWKRGFVPPTGTDAKAPLTQGRPVIGGLAGDRGILAAMRFKEDDTNQAHEQALQRRGILPEARPVPEAKLDDERRAGPGSTTGRASIDHPSSSTVGGRSLSATPTPTPAPDVPTLTEQQHGNC